MKTINSTIEIAVAEGEWIEMPVTVEFEFHPGEKQSRDCPGEDSWCEIVNVKSPWGYELSPHMEQKTVDRFAEEALEKINDDIDDARASRYERD